MNPARLSLPVPTDSRDLAVGGKEAGPQCRHRPVRLPQPGEQLARLPGIFRGTLDVRARTITDESASLQLKRSRRGPSSKG